MARRLLDDETLPREAELMIQRLNTRKPRHILGWKTPAEIWNARPAIAVDREELRAEVEDRAARLRLDPRLRGRPGDLPWRLAIETALTRRGLLRREVGGWC